MVMCYGKLEFCDRSNQDKPPRVLYVSSKAISTRVKSGLQAFSASKKLNHRLELFVMDKETKVIIQLAFDSDYELEVCV